VHDRERAQVVGPDGEDPAVVVAAGLLDGPGVLGDVGELIVGVVVQFLEIEDDLVAGLAAGGPSLGEQLGHGYPVEVGRFGQPGNGPGATAALVRATTTAFHRPDDFSSTPCRESPCCWRMERRRAPRDLAYSEGICLSQVAWLRVSSGRSLRSVTVTGKRHPVKCCYRPVSRSALLVGSPEPLVRPVPRSGRRLKTSFNDPSREAGKEVRCGVPT